MDHLLDETQSQATSIIDDIDSKTSNNPNNKIKNTEPLKYTSNNNNNNQHKTDDIKGPSQMQLLETGNIMFEPNND